MLKWLRAADREHESDHTTAVLQDPETIARLVHIEQKVDVLVAFAKEAKAARPSYGGHPDQAFGNLTYAQCGEDLIVANLFTRLGIDRPSYIDVGAHHPLYSSNTALLYGRGSRGINVEPNPHLIEAIHQYRPEDTTLNLGIAPHRGELDFFFIDDLSGRNTFDRATAEAFVAASRAAEISRVQTIQVTTLNDVVHEHSGGRWPDFLSLDAEGLDHAILSAADFGPSPPPIVCVEAISGNAKDDAPRLRSLMESRGYVLGFRTVVNLIFVRADLARRLD